MAFPGIVLIGAARVAGTALLGFAAGVAMSRDPEGTRRLTRRVLREAALAFERASLMAAQAREQLGDMWEEARAEAVAEVDKADFQRTAARSQAEAGDASAVPSATARRAATERGRPRRSAAMHGEKLEKAGHAPISQQPFDRQQRQQPDL